LPGPHPAFTPSYGERGCVRRGEVQLPQGPRKGFFRATPNIEQRCWLTWRERHAETIEIHREAVTPGLEVRFLSNPAGEERSQFSFRRQRPKSGDLLLREQALRDQIDVDICPDAFHVNADVASTSNGAERNVMRMSDVEAQGIRSALGDQCRLAVWTAAELQVTRVRVEIAPKDQPQHPATSSETVAVSLKVKPRGSLAFLLREDAIDVLCGKPRLVQIREPYMDLIMWQSERL
jgi:hypothetical protein